MIVVDTSALVCILKRETDASAFVKVLTGSDRIVIAAPTKFELTLVMGNFQGLEGVTDARLVLRDFAIKVVDWTDALADLAADAFLRFGKGRGHSAQLNFGDCMAYALAKSLDARLLYKGDDFARTDIRAAT